MVDWALDSENKLNHVNAKDPYVMKHRLYQCPVCRSPVRLRKGQKRVPYFAHVSGAADDLECKLYSPSTYIKVPGNYMRAAPELYIRVLDGSDAPPSVATTSTYS